MNRIYIWFDDYLKCRSGKVIPYYDFTIVEDEVNDQEVRWFHEGYGRMRLYRLWKVDEENFIAEYTGKSSSTSDPRWNAYRSNPELALGA